jgi:hypothetical protein
MAYGTDIKTLAKYLVRRHELSNDPSADLLQYLAMAYAAARKLEEQGIKLGVGAAPPVLPGIERAYREAMHLRSKLPNEMLDVNRITRFGRVKREGEN